MRILPLPHDCLNVLNRARNCRREVFAPIFRYQQVVLQAEADAPFLVVDAHVDAEHHARFDRQRTLDNIMHVVAHMVCAAVPHIAPDVFRLVQHARVAEQRRVVAANRRIHLRHREARLDNGEHVVRRLQRTVEQQLLLVREAPVARETAADVGHQAVMLRADVVEYHVAVVRLSAVGIIVDAEVVLPRADDGRERGPLRAVLGQRVVKFRLVLIFVHPRTARLHHCQNALARHLFRLADGVDFAGLLDEPQTAQDGVRVLDLQIGVIRLNLLQQPMRR